MTVRGKDQEKNPPILQFTPQKITLSELHQDAQAAARPHGGPALRGPGAVSSLGPRGKDVHGAERALSVLM